MSQQTSQLDLVTPQQIRRVYAMSTSYIYDSDFLDSVIVQLLWILRRMSPSKTCSTLCTMLEDAVKGSDEGKVVAIDAVLHTAHTSGFYAQHLVQGKDKLEIMNFLSELAGIGGSEYDVLIDSVKSTQVEYTCGVPIYVSTVPNRALYGTIELTGFEELNRTAIRNTRERFNDMGIIESSFTGKTLLDIGCNVGHMLIEATSYGFPKSWGLEHSQKIVNVGRAIIQYLRLSDYLKLLCADANKLTTDRLNTLTGRTSFDIVFCFAVDGYIKVPEVFYRLLTDITTDTLYFEPNNHKIEWNADLIKSWGFHSVEKVSVPYDKETGSRRDCFICRKKERTV